MNVYSQCFFLEYMYMYIQFDFDVLFPAVAIWFFWQWISKLIFSSTFKRKIGLQFFRSQWGHMTWNRGYWSNSPPPMSGAPRKTKMIKFPFPQAGKGIKCSRVCPGRDVEASILCCFLQTCKWTWTSVFLRQHSYMKLYVYSRGNVYKSIKTHRS